MLHCASAAIFAVVALAVQPEAGAKRHQAQDGQQHSPVKSRPAFMGLVKVRHEEFERRADAALYVDAGGTRRLMLLNLSLLEPPASRDVEQKHGRNDLERRSNATKLDRGGIALETMPSCLARDIDRRMQGLRSSLTRAADITVDTVQVVVLALSIVLLVLGHRIINAVACITAVCLAFFLTLRFSLDLADAYFPQDPSACTWSLYGAIAVGALAGALAMLFLDIAVVVAGATVGAILAYEVKYLILIIVPSLSGSLVMRHFWVIAAVVALLSAYVVHELREAFFIVVTSVLGAYGLTVSVAGLIASLTPNKMSSLAAEVTFAAAFMLGLLVQSTVAARRT